MNNIQAIIRGITGDVPNVYVFGASSNSIHNGMNLYSLKLWENNILIRDFVPCYRKSDNEIGLFDRVNNKFYENSGTGTFATGAQASNQNYSAISQVFEYGTPENLQANTYSRKGAIFAGWNTNIDGSGTQYNDGQEIMNLSSIDGEIINLYAQWEVAGTYIINFMPNYNIPEEYTVLEYIANNGSQYIDLGITPSNTLKTDIVFVDSSASSAGYVLGSMNGSEIAYGITGSNGSKEIAVAFMNRTNATLESEDQELARPRSKNAKYHIRLDVEYDAQYGYAMHGYLDNLTNNTSKDAYSNYVQNGIAGTYSNIFVFGHTTKNIHKGMQLYTLKFWDGDEMIRNLIPVARTANNQETLGLYDLITGTFYQNSGKGTLIKGTEKTLEASYTQEMTYNVAQSLTLNSFAKEGYTFAGWNTAEDGSGTTYLDEEEFINSGVYEGDEINLYAQWVPNSFTIMAYNNAETMETVEEISSDEENILNEVEEENMENDSVIENETTEQT